MKYLLLVLLLTACGEEIQTIQGPKGDTGAQGMAGRDGLDGADGLDGKDGADGIDGTNGVDGKDGSDAAAQVTSVNFVDTTECKAIIDESGLKVYGQKSSISSNTVVVYFNSACAGQNEQLSPTSNETMYIGTSLLVLTGLNTGPQPLTVVRIKL